MVADFKTLGIILLIVLTMVGSVSAYYCNYDDDNNQVKLFKEKINILALEQDIKEHSITQEAFKLKIKYFNSCQ